MLKLSRSISSSSSSSQCQCELYVTSLTSIAAPVATVAAITSQCHLSCCCQFQQSSPPSFSRWRHEKFSHRQLHAVIFVVLVTSSRMTVTLRRKSTNEVNYS